MSKASKAHARCVICGRQGTEQNHVGGRHHVAWFTMAFCIEHHKQFHALLRNAGVNLEYTANTSGRRVRALKAIKIAEWMLLEGLEGNSNA
jgi:hypothetical protein